MEKSSTVKAKLLLSIIVVPPLIAFSEIDDSFNRWLVTLLWGLFFIFIIQPFISKRF
ncbi:hypothetical protein ACFQ4N_13805 [Oceanobacillus iheyensis]|uniref:Uncharacterized protein n=1 Tax=Oceanobacillus iheyensis (strain DSM 14371 / CIP 107618 / JCM 11309 / KCTC 3954 / HTE831) TaxID=221109 RepID=Q8ETJ3_OCEIH|nr:hypothetical protein [Oceanobacillus iheyensis HTE831]